MITIDINSHSLTLGPTLDVLQSFGEMGRLVTKDDGKIYAELFSLPGYDGEELDKEMSGKVADQARQFLAEFPISLHNNTRAMLQEIAATGGSDE